MCPRTVPATHRARAGLGSAFASFVRLALALALVDASCSHQGMPVSYHAAEQYERRGDDSAALAAYRRAARECTAGPRCAPLELRIGELLVRLGKQTEAREHYVSIGTRTTSRAVAARGLQRAAEIDERTKGARDSALALYRRVIEEYPDQAAADDALRALVRLYRARHRTTELPGLLAELWKRLQRREIGDNLLYAAAELYRASSQLDQARSLYRRLAERYPHSGLRDDSLWHAAQLCEQQHRWSQALRHYRTLLEHRRDAMLIGSYNSVYMDDAQLRIGLIYMQHLSDDERALRAFELLRDDFPDSRLRDDAQWWIAELHRKRGRTAQACSALALLIRRFPDGNHVRRARERRAAICTPRAARRPGEPPSPRGIESPP